MNGSGFIRGRRLRLLVSGASATLAALALTASPAAAVTVACNEVITVSTTVSNDLTDCVGNGLVIGADNITLDLRGHTIDGDFTDSDSGIMSANHTGVKIRNGTVRQFNDGIFVTGGSGNLVDAVTAFDNNNAGIELFNSDTNRVDRSRTPSAVWGVLLNAGSDNNVVQHTAASQQMAGIAAVNESNNNQIGGNTMSQVGLGVVVDAGSDGNHVTGNIIDGSFSTGIGVGVFFGGGADNTRIEANSVTNTGGGGDGIAVGAGQEGTLLSRNSSSKNAGDGIDVQSPATTLTRNIANSNGGHGINAVAGVTNGGGNSASGNQTPPQCVNVSCP
jgi:parallel beta-helix repeat protein